MIIRINSQQTDYVMPRYKNREVIVAIDSSKTNSAFAVSDMNGNIIDYVEFNGAGDGTSEQDTLLLCYHHRQCLSELFKDSKPKIVGIENIITKDSKRKEVGISIHMSRFKITAVFMSFISFFQDSFGLTVDLVNNQTWKSTVLPAQFCTRAYVKGSLAYFKSIGSKYQYCSDDVTDAICILEYLCKLYDITKGVQIGQAEVAKYPFSYFIINTRQHMKTDSVRFLYNEELTLEQNVSFIVNTIKEDCYGVTNVPIKYVSLEDIYKRSVGSFNTVENMLQFVVKRE